MKIERSKHFWSHSTEYEHLIADFKQVARQLQVEHGVFIDVCSEYCEDGVIVTRVYFKVMDHEFETGRELRKALENKAFV